MSGIPSLAFASEFTSRFRHRADLHRWLDSLAGRSLAAPREFQHKDSRPKSERRKVIRAPEFSSPRGTSPAGRWPGSSSRSCKACPRSPSTTPRSRTGRREQSILPGPNADLLALLPFTVLCVLLYLVGRDVILAANRDAPGRSSRCDDRGRAARRPYQFQSRDVSHAMNVSTRRELTSTRGLSQTHRRYGRAPAGNRNDIER